MEFECGSDDELSDTVHTSDDNDDETSGEVGEIDVADEPHGGAQEGDATGELVGKAQGGPVEADGLSGDWQYEPLPHGRPGDNVGDAGPMPGRLQNLDG